jgi:hypothetical protein
MKGEIGIEAAPFPERKYINGIFLTVQGLFKPRISYRNGLARRMISIRREREAFNPNENYQGRKGPCFFQKLIALKCLKCQKIQKNI